MSEMYLVKSLFVMATVSSAACQSLGLGVEDQLGTSSSLHYNFDHSYGYTDHQSPVIGYKHKHGHHYTDIGNIIINKISHITVIHHL